MRITIVQGAFLPVPPILGGAVEKLWYGLGREFARKGHKVVHISRDYPGFSKRDCHDGLEYIRIPGEEYTNISLVNKIKDLRYTLNSLKIIPDSDIIVSNTFWLPIVIKSSKGKIIIDVQRMPKGQLRFLSKKNYFRANSSATLKAIINERGNEINTVMIPNSLPFSDIDLPEIKNKKNILLYCGRVHPEKGIGLVMEYSRKIPRNWTIRIVGPYAEEQGGGGAEYLEFLKSRALRSCVEFVGPIFDENQLLREYADAKIFLYPSLAERGETFGLAPLEAMACGCVPIVSDLDCFKDFIHHEYNGLIFDHRKVNASFELSQKIEELVHDNNKIEKLSKNAMQVRVTHSLEAIAEEFLGYFNSITTHS